MIASASRVKGWILFTREGEIPVEIDVSGETLLLILGEEGEEEVDPGDDSDEDDACKAWSAIILDSQYDFNSSLFSMMDEVSTTTPVKKKRQQSMITKKMDEKKEVSD